MYAGRFSYDQQNVHDEQQWANQVSYPSQQHYSQQYNYPPPNQHDRFQNNGAGYPQQGGRGGGYPQNYSGSGFQQRGGYGIGGGPPRYQHQMSHQNSRWSRLDESGGGGGGGHGGLATNWEQQGPENPDLEAELFSR